MREYRNVEDSVPVHDGIFDTYDEVNHVEEETGLDRSLCNRSGGSGIAGWYQFRDQGSY